MPDRHHQPPARHRTMTAIVLLALGALLVPWQAAGASAAEAALDTDKARARLGQPTVDALTAMVRQLRLRGWEVVVCDDDGVPRGWRALAGGLHLRLAKAGRTTDLWALPDDWIGVCQVADPPPSPPPPGLETVAGVRCVVLGDNLGGSIADAFRQPHAAQAGPWHPQPPPPRKAWTPEQVAIADARAREALAILCPERRNLAQGIYSLATLGVPAHPLYQELALAGDPEVRMAAIAALAEVADAASMRFLGRMLNHAEPDPSYRAILLGVAAALRRTADPESIPDLLTALDHIDDPEILSEVVAALAGLGCREAGPRILGLLRHETRSHFRAEFAQALAILRVTEAAALIRSWLPERDITGMALLEEQRSPLYPSLRISYLALTAPWSDTVAHARLLLVPLAPTVPLGDGCRVTLLVEACGEAIEWLDYVEGVVTIDGVDHQIEAGMANGNFTLAAGDAIVQAIELGAWITAAGRHQVRYRSGALTSNQVEVVVSGP